MKFCAEQMNEYIKLITEGDPAAAVNAEPIQRFEAFLSRLSKVDVQSIFDRGLHEFLDSSQVEIACIGAHLYTNYMYHPPVDLQAEIRFQQQQEQQQQ